MNTTNKEKLPWQEYRTRLLNFVSGRVRSSADAEDIVHDVLTRAYGQRDTVRDYDKLTAWLYQIARNTVIDYYRKRRSHEALSDVDLVSDKAGGASARAELARCIQPLIESLPAPYRNALEMSEIDGLTQRETAVRLGLSHSGAKSRVQRGRAMIEEKIWACCKIEFDSRGGLMDYTPRGTCQTC